MRLRIAAFVLVLLAYGSPADATIVNVVDCATKKPISGAQTKPVGEDPASETLRYQLSAPGYSARSISVFVGSVNEACLEPKETAPEDSPGQTPSGAKGNSEEGNAGDWDDDYGQPRNRDRERNRELLRVPGPSADERARGHLDDRNAPPVPWVDTGQAEDVGGQIHSIGDLLNSKQPPPTQTRTRPPTSPPNTAATTETNPTPEFVPGGASIDAVEEISNALCLASDPTAAANEKADAWGAYCADLTSLKAKEGLRQAAKSQGKDPDKAHPYSAAETQIKATIARLAATAATAAGASCGQKITCKKLACKSRCIVAFEKLLESTSCKQKQRRGLDGKPVMLDRLRTKVIGNCTCECPPDSSCAGIESAL